ncbi:hypothetical protein ACIHAA_25495 [Streptomyces sp. NPDC052040]|uniref:hypothetical protein n=1 Tax=Streptomyces sp. NPDC052040 TaxID=3365682 RepID=UPI0037D3C474
MAAARRMTCWSAPTARYWVLGNGQSLSAQRNGDGRIRIYLSFYTAEDWFTTSAIPLAFFQAS